MQSGPRVFDRRPDVLTPIDLAHVTGRFDTLHEQFLCSGAVVLRQLAAVELEDGAAVVDVVPVSCAED